MSTLSTERKPPLDYGVQIRFIKDLADTGGGYPPGARGNSSGGSAPATSPASKYGVAVRVQGIAGQPYVVLKEGEKGDSYGVQLKSGPPTQAPPPATPLSSHSLPRRKEEKPDPSQPLGRAQSQDSLLDRKAMADFRGLVARPPGDGRSGSHGTLNGGTVNGAERRDVNGEPVGLASSAETHHPAIDEKSLPSVDRLIGRFGGSSGKGLGAPPRVWSKPPTRPKPRERLRSGSLDVHDGFPPPPLPASAPSPIPSPYCASPTPSSTSSCSSLGRSYTPGGRIMARPLASTPTSSWSLGRAVAKETPSITQTETQATPDLLRDQGQSAEVTSKEERAKQAVYSILKEGTNENAVTTKRKVDLVFEKLQDLGVSQTGDLTMKAELEECLQENLRLQEQLDRKTAELHQTHTDLTQLRMEREAAELRGRVLEDQLAQQQEDLRRAAEDAALHTDAVSAQAELSQSALLQQRLEETLRQRERELTALKGALKDEVATHDQEIEELREQYVLDMERLRSSMEQVSQSQLGIETERQKVNATINSLEEHLDASREELSTTKEERRSYRTEPVLLQARLEKEEFEEELKELQKKLKNMKEQIPDASQTHTLTQDLCQCQDNLKQARSDLERLKAQLDKKEAELQALKKASDQQEAEQSQEIDRLKLQSQKDKEELARALEKAKQPASEEAGWGAERLKDRLAGAERELQVQKTEQQELQETNTRLRDKITRLEARLACSSSDSSEAELLLEEETRGLRAQLEEARRGLSRLGQERDELSRRLEDRDREREGLRRGKTDLEEQKRLLDRSLEKINKEMEQMSSESRHSVQGLQVQLEEYRERSRKELQDAQRLGKDRLAELQRAQCTSRALQEEVLRLKKELLVCSEQRDSAQLEKDLLSNRLKHSEEELEAEKSLHTDRSREIRALEDQVKQLEMDLDEEKTNTELLDDRAARCRDQVDQLRSELMQERSSRQDVEVDKSVLERQVKELRGRVADMEGQVRPAAAPHLEIKVKELEDRLLSEEREKNSLHSAQRRLERKLKDLNITLEEERQRHSGEKDQLALRVKALKRQVDERDGEVERLEALRRKALREGEEQLEQREAAQARVSALEAELKRKAQQSRRPTLSSEEDEGLDNASSIASLLSERHLHTGTC